MAEKLAKMRRTSAQEFTQDRLDMCPPTLESETALDRASPFQLKCIDAVCDTLVKLEVSGGDRQVDDVKFAASPEAGASAVPADAEECEASAALSGDTARAQYAQATLPDAKEHECADDEAEDGVDRHDRQDATGARESTDGGDPLLDHQAAPIADIYAFAVPSQIQEKRLANRLVDLKLGVTGVLDLEGECSLFRETTTEQHFFYASDKELVRLTNLEFCIIVDAAEHAGWAVKTSKGRAHETWTISIPDDASKWNVDDVTSSANTGLEDAADLYGFVSPKFIQFRRLQRTLERLKQDVLAVIEATGICDVHDEGTHYFMQGLRQVPLTPLEHRIIIESADRAGWKLDRTNDRKTRRWRIRFPPTDAPRTSRVGIVTPARDPLRCHTEPVPHSPLDSANQDPLDCIDK